MNLAEAVALVEKLATYEVEGGGGSDGSKPSPVFNLQLSLSTATNGDRFASVTATENYLVRQIPWADALAEVGELFPTVTVRAITTGPAGAGMSFD
jgi:hypothetical protein